MTSTVYIWISVAGIAVAAVIGWVSTYPIRSAKKERRAKEERVWDAIVGVDASPGIPRTLSLIERVTILEHSHVEVKAKLESIDHKTAQLVSNGGSSIKDQITQLTTMVKEIANKET